MSHAMTKSPLPEELLTHKLNDGFLCTLLKLLQLLGYIPSKIPVWLLGCNTYDWVLKSQGELSL